MLEEQRFAHTGRSGKRACVILSEAKDRKMRRPRILRSFAIYAAQDDERHVIPSAEEREESRASRDGLTKRSISSRAF